MELEGRMAMAIKRRMKMKGRWLRRGRDCSVEALLMVVGCFSGSDGVECESVEVLGEK